MMVGVRCNTMVDGVSVSEAIRTTFITSGSATLLAMLLGVLLGAWCARQHHAAFSKLKTVVTALYGLPPVVVGVFVYSLFSKSGALGWMDLLFTVEAMIFAQTVLIFPLVWGGSWTAFQGVGKEYNDTLATLGIGARQRLIMEIRLCTKRCLPRHGHRAWSSDCGGGGGDYGWWKHRWENACNDHQHRA